MLFTSELLSFSTIQVSLEAYGIMVLILFGTSCKFEELCSTCFNKIFLRRKKNEIKKTCQKIWSEFVLILFYPGKLRRQLTYIYENPKMTINIPRLQSLKISASYFVWDISIIVDKETRGGG